MALPTKDLFTITPGTDLYLQNYSASWSVTDSSHFLIYYAHNAVAGNTAAVRHFARWNADTFNDDQFSQLTAHGVDSNFYVSLGPAVRVDTGGARTGYAVTWGGTAYIDGNETTAGAALIKVVANSVTTLATLSNPTAGQVVRITAEGTSTTSLKVYYDGVQQGSTYNDSSSPITSGAAGIFAIGQSANNRGDNWVGGNLTAATTVTGDFSGTYGNLTDKGTWRNWLPDDLQFDGTGTPDYVYNGNGNNTADFYTGDYFGADQFSQATDTFHRGSPNYDASVVGVRMSGTGSARNGYIFETYLSTGYGRFLKKLVAGSSTTLASDASYIADEDVIKITAVGTTITAYVNGAQVFQVTDSALTTGAPGLGIVTSGGTDSIHLIDWSGGAATADAVRSLLTKTIP